MVDPTDSLIVYIQCSPEEYFEKMVLLSWLYDYSNLDKNHPLYSKHNAGVAGKLKIEMESIQEFLGLSAKCYSLLQNKPITTVQRVFQCPPPETSKQLAKGVPKSFMRDKKHEYYRSILTDQTLGLITSRHIRAKHQQLVTLTQVKKGFTPLDLKRYYIDNIKSLPYGHKKIKLLEGAPADLVEDETHE
jgi:hypothetical protein